MTPREKAIAKSVLKLLQDDPMLWSNVEALVAAELDITPDEVGDIITELVNDDNLSYSRDAYLRIPEDDD